MYIRQKTEKTKNFCGGDGENPFFPGAGRDQPVMSIWGGSEAEAFCAERSFWLAM